MKKLDRYFVYELFKVLLLSLVVAQLVLLSLQAIRLSSLIINQGLEISLIVKMISGLALSFLPIVFPISFLFSLLIVFGRMASDSELLALQSMGRSPWRLLRPSLGVGLCVALMTLWVGFYGGPQGNRLFEASIETAYKKKVTAVLRAGTFSEGFLNRVVFVDQIDPLTQELRRVFLFDENSFGENTAISATSGRWTQDAQTGLGVLNLYDGLILVQNHKSDRLQRIRFDEYRLNADFSSELGRSRNSPASQDLNNLIQLRAEFKEGTKKGNPREVWIEIARRFAVALACLLFVPLCFALVLDNSRTAKNRAVFSGLIIVLLYWSSYFGISTWFQKVNIAAFTKYEILSWVFISIPNAIIFGTGFYLFSKRSKLSAK
jgi:lipopolysaccharide export system permease protein